MLAFAENGYKQVARETASPISIEHRLLNSIAGEMERADPKTSDGFRQLVNAVDKNSKLWCALATDLLSSGNNLGPELKENLIGLARFSISHGMKIMAGDGSVDALIEINRAVATGLAASATMTE